MPNNTAISIPGRFHDGEHSKMDSKRKSGGITGDDVEDSSRKRRKTVRERLCANRCEYCITVRLDACLFDCDAMEKLRTAWVVAWGRDGRD